MNYREIVDSTTLRRMIWSPRDKSWLFHHSNLLSSWLNSGAQSCSTNLPGHHRMPKYLTGKKLSLHPKILVISGNDKFLSPRLRRELLWKLILSPNHNSKQCKIQLKAKKKYLVLLWDDCWRSWMILCLSRTLENCSWCLWFSWQQCYFLFVSFLFSPVEQRSWAGLKLSSQWRC